MKGGWILFAPAEFYLFEGNVSLISGDPPDKDGSLKSFSFEINTFSLRKRRYLSH